MYNGWTMRKFLTILATFTMTALPAFGDTGWNTFTGYAKNQIVFNIGQGVDSGFLLPPPVKPVPFYIMHLQYSQPTTFFSLPARQSLNIAQTIGFGEKYGWKWEDYTIPMVMLSGDVRLSEYKNLYVAMGAGVGLQAQQNERLGAKLLFQFKLLAGYHFNERWGMEIFVQHFSNANTALENYSYAFYGAGITYSF